MARAPRQAQDTAKYHSLDPNATTVAGQKLPVDTDGKPTETTVELTPAQAAFGIANGTISTKNPESNKRAAEAVEANLGEAHKDKGGRKR